MIEEAKIEAVREYLQSEFPKCQIDDYFDDERLSQKFRVINDSTILIVKFERIFLDDTSDIKKVLQIFELGKFMRQNAGKQLLVTKHVLKIL